jgi:hypothetical protein
MISDHGGGKKFVSTAPDRLEGNPPLAWAERL